MFLDVGNDFLFNVVLEESCMVESCCKKSSFFLIFKFDDII